MHIEAVHHNYVLLPSDIFQSEGHLIHSFIHSQSIDPVYSHNRQQDVDFVKS
jgi:hypothetical protein